MWQEHDDSILSRLCSSLINRKLYKVELQTEPFDAAYLDTVKKTAQMKFALRNEDIDYFVFSDTIENRIYNKEKAPILLQYKDGSTKEISDTFDLFNVANLTKPVIKHFLCQLK